MPEDKPQMTFSTICDSNLLTKVKITAAAKKLTIQQAVDQALTDWVNKNEDAVTKFMEG